MRQQQQPHLLQQHQQCQQPRNIRQIEQHARDNNDEDDDYNDDSLSDISDLTPATGLNTIANNDYDHQSESTQAFLINALSEEYQIEDTNRQNSNSASFVGESVGNKRKMRTTSASAASYISPITQVDIGSNPAQRVRRNSNSTDAHDTSQESGFSNELEGHVRGGAQRGFEDEEGYDESCGGSVRVDIRYFIDYFCLLFWKNVLFFNLKQTINS
jgi:hypothetical protein